MRDRRAEAQPYKGMSQTKVKSRMYASKFPTERSPVAKCVMIAEANTDAPKSFCDAPDGTGHRVMARSESSARELGRPADAKAAAGVGGSRSSGEAGNDRGAKGSCIESASNRSAGADSLRKKRMTDEEIAAIAAKHRMAKFPNLALTRESRQVAPADALRPLPPRVGGREKGKVRNTAFSDRQMRINR